MHWIWKYCPILAILLRFYVLLAYSSFPHAIYFSKNLFMNWVLRQIEFWLMGPWQLKVVTELPVSGKNRCDRWTLRLRWRWCNKYSYLVFFSRQHFSAMAATFRSCRSSPLYHTRLKFWMELLFVLSPCAISFTWYIAIVLTCRSFINSQRLLFMLSQRKLEKHTLRIYLVYWI